MATYQGRKVKLGKPFRTPGQSKKFAVYVKDKKTNNVKKVRFGERTKDFESCVLVNKSMEEKFSIIIYVQDFRSTS